MDINITLKNKSIFFKYEWSTNVFRAFQCASFHKWGKFSREKSMAPKDMFLRVLSPEAELGSVKRCCHGNHPNVLPWGSTWDMLNNISRFTTQCFKNATYLQFLEGRSTEHTSTATVKHVQTTFPLPSPPLFSRTGLCFGAVNGLVWTKTIM